MKKPLFCSVCIVVLFASVDLAESSSSIVISQVYGGGGNSGSTLRNDFVELFNRSSAAVAVDGWTIQYASSAGSTWDSIGLSGSILAGQYYLVAAGGSTGGTVSLPQSQATGSVNFSATTGKIALVSTTALLTGTCPTTGVVDFVGYGDANCTEGSSAPTLTNTTALLRATSGCTDTDNNASDFTTGSPSPRTASSPVNACSSTTAYTLTVTKSGTGSGTVTSSPAGISCGTDCSENYASGTSVTLTASASSGSTFGGWSGDCTGASTCAITMSQARSVTAPFALSTTGATKPTVGSASLIFPHFAQGSGYQTNFTFNNFSSTSTAVTLEFLSQAGTLLGSTELTLTALGSAGTAMTGSTLSVGWVRATANPAAEIAGTETIQLFNSAGSLLVEAGVLAAQPDTTLRLPVYQKNGFDTGVAIVNLGSSNTTVNMTIRAANGTIAATSSLSLASFSQTARYVGSLFPSLTDFEGMLELTSANTIAVLALRQNLISQIFSTFPVAAVGTEVYFSPNAGTSTRIVQEIGRAFGTLDVAIYSFTLDEIADALIAARNRGVAVRILADSSQANGTGSEVAKLEAAGFQLKRTNGGSGGIMHNKFAIFDGRVLLTGSYNWSANAEQNNDENAVFIRDMRVISAFQANFNSMWSSR